MIVLLLTFLVYNISSAVILGDSCILKSGDQGVCELWPKCQAAIDDFEKNVSPQVCDIEGSTPIVCCDKKVTKPLGKDRPVGEISKEKCKEYRSYIYESIRPLIIGLPVQLVGRCVTYNLLIRGGRALPREFPHQAILGYEKDKEIFWKCGGSLISEDYVITAARCLNAGRGEMTLKFVRLGDLNYKTTDDDADPQTFEVEKIVLHPDFKPRLMYNDIALIKLNQSAVLNKYVRPACLQTEFAVHENKTEGSGLRVITSGYGEWKCESEADLLQFILDSYSYEACASMTVQTRRLPRGIDKQSQFCAGGEIDDCPLHGGSPVQVFHDKYRCMHKLIGVASFGPYTYTVYTRISNYIEWIEKEVWGRSSQ